MAAGVGGDCNDWWFPSSTSSVHTQPQISILTFVTRLLDSRIGWLVNSLLIIAATRSGYWSTVSQLISVELIGDAPFLTLVFHLILSMRWSHPVAASSRPLRGHTVWLQLIGIRIGNRTPRAVRRFHVQEHSRSVSSFWRSAAIKIRPVCRKFITRQGCRNGIKQMLNWRVIRGWGQTDDCGNERGELVTFSSNPRAVRMIHDIIGPFAEKRTPSAKNQREERKKEKEKAVKTVAIAKQRYHRLVIIWN